MTTREKRWFEQYKLCKEYYENNGDLLIPQKYVYKGYHIGEFIRIQRKAYTHGTLSNERINLLNQIGMVWRLASPKRDWDDFYNLAKSFYQENGHLKLSNKSEYYKGINLGSWVAAQRDNYKNRKLTKEQIRLLESIGMVWSYVQQWEDSYNLLVEYMNETGSIDMPSDFVYKGFALARWKYKQRERYRMGLLSEERTKKLLLLGFKFD